MIVLFDYVFYRVAKFFYRKDGIDAIRAIAVVTIVQGFLAGEVLTIVLRLFFSLDEIAKFSISVSKVGIAVALILLFLNYQRYKGKYWKFADRWRSSESQAQTIQRGWLVVLVILIPYVLLILLGTVFGR